MDAPLQKLPDNVPELQLLVAQQRAQLDQKQHVIEQHQHTLTQKRDKIEQHLKTISSKQTAIEQLEERLRQLQQQRFGKSSEKHPGQAELTFFNEAELLQLEAVLTEPLADTISVPAHTRKAVRPRALPSTLARVEVVHDLNAVDKVCSCGQTMTLIGHEDLEQLALIPLQYYVIKHRKCKYACACKAGVRTAAMPKQPLPASQASPQLLAQVMVAKYHDGLPLYRQEKIAAREGVELPRAKLARWMIDGSAVLQPVWNLLQDAFFSYDIAATDETGIQVLKEAGRSPHNKSYLWIRRGGPPDNTVVLVDYSPSRSGDMAYSLLDDFKGYLICDGYAGYNKAIENNQLEPVYCNDHARRKFVEVIKSLGKGSEKDKTKGWAASKAVAFYKQLYRIEKGIKTLSHPQKLEVRQAQAVPVWQTFLDWAREVQQLGVAHKATREALAYLLKHAEGLTRYCDDGRLPISNILAEHVAKAIAISRKNFLFADTPAGADASARIFSLLETAKANQHHPQRYLSVLLCELPNVSGIDDIEALLPWRLTPEEVNRRYATYPAP